MPCNFDEFRDKVNQEICNKESVSINEILPVEIIEKILIDTVILQFATSDPGAVISRCLGGNLASVCSLWRNILKGTQFRQSFLRNVDPKTLYKQRAQPVQITGVGDECYKRGFNILSALTFNDNLYTIEAYKKNPSWLDKIYHAAKKAIFFYDIQFMYHRQTDSFELVCTNRRRITDWSASLSVLLLSSKHNNCLYAYEEPADITELRQVYQLDLDGAVLSRWHIINNPGRNVNRMAIDPLGQYLVFSGSQFAAVYTPGGDCLAKISIDESKQYTISCAWVLSDSTLVVNYIERQSAANSPNQKTCYANKVALLKASKKLDGSLQYPDIELPDAEGCGMCRVIKESNKGQTLDRFSMVVDSQGCTVILNGAQILVIDDKLVTSHRRTDWDNCEIRFRTTVIHSMDESRGLLFLDEWGPEYMSAFDFNKGRHSLCCFSVRYCV